MIKLLVFFERFLLTLPYLNEDKEIIPFDAEAFMQDGIVNKQGQKLQAIGYQIVNDPHSN